MQTPAGKECRYYYEDFHRGRNIQECRLVKDSPESLRWKPDDCFKCPVPDILNANADPDLVLKLVIKSSFLGFRRQLEVSAHCRKHNIEVEDPYVGCPHCREERPGLDLFRQALDDDND